MNFNNTDIKEIIKQDKLVHTNAISKREHGLKNGINQEILIKGIMHVSYIVLHSDAYKEKCKF